MKKNRQVKVLIAKPGLDGHDRGAKVIALGLRDEGFEVVYSGVRQSPEKIVAAAIQEDVDVVGLSCLSGAHNYLFPRVAQLLSEKAKQDVLLIGGGIISTEDFHYLQTSGISAIFGPGTFIREIADYIRKNLKW